MKKYIIVMGILVILIAVAVIIQMSGYNDRKIRLSQISVEWQKKILLTDNEKKQSLKQLIVYLNKEKYYDCDRIVFLNNKIDTSKNKKYFYAKIVGYDDSLIEITNLSSGKFKYRYLGNKLNVNYISPKTGVTYLQIVNPKEYEKQQELKKIIEDGKTATPIPNDAVQDSNDSYIIE